MNIRHINKHHVMVFLFLVFARAIVWLRYETSIIPSLRQKDAWLSVTSVYLLVFLLVIFTYGVIRLSAHKINWRRHAPCYGLIFGLFLLDILCTYIGTPNLTNEGNSTVLSLMDQSPDAPLWELWSILLLIMSTGVIIPLCFYRLLTIIISYGKIPMLLSIVTFLPIVTREVYGDIEIFVEWYILIKFWNNEWDIVVKSLFYIREVLEKLGYTELGHEVAKLARISVEITEWALMIPAFTMLIYLTYFPKRKSKDLDEPTALSASSS